MTDDRQKVRDATDIVEVVGEVVALKPKGREYVCLCPFHDDHNPSMYVVPAKQLFHCFVCGAGGDVFTFVQQYHKMAFREALEHLAERAGIELTRHRPDPARAGEPTRADLSEANAFAQRFFRRVLEHPEHGAGARRVIGERAISDDMVDRFEIGASPDRWDGLKLKIESQGLDARSFLDAGVLKPRDGGGAYDALRNRLIFPIHDQVGRVIAFGARRIDDADEPKYLNSPESRLFSKSETLYGIHQAARSIQRENTAIVVEGYTDVIACHQAGIGNVVGTLGTALTPGHAKVLRRLCDTVVLLFDGDDAGRAAAGRGMERLLDELVEEILFRGDGHGALDVRFASIADSTDAKDPDELLRAEGGADRLRELLTSAPDLISFRFERLRRDLADRTPAGQERALSAELERLRALGVGRLPPVRKRLLTKRLSEASGIDEATIWAEMPAGRDRGPKPTQTEDSGNAEPRELALGCLMADGRLWETLGERERDLLAVDAYRSPVSRMVADAVNQLGYDGEAISLHSVQDIIAEHAPATGGPVPIDETGSAEEATALASRLHWTATRIAGDDLSGLAELITGCLRRAAERDDWEGLATEQGASDPAMRIENLKKYHAEHGMNRRVRLSRE